MLNTIFRVMELYIKNMVCQRCVKVVKEELHKANVPVANVQLGIVSTATDLTDTTALSLRRDATRFDGRFRVPAVLDWTRAATAGNPLPPLDGTLSTPQLEIAGAQLQGVEVEFEGDGVDASTAASPNPSP